MILPLSYSKDMKTGLITVVLMCLLVQVLVAETGCFEHQYILEKSFAKFGVEFGNVSDVVVNEREQHVLVLQRSYPPVSVWSKNGTLLFTWKTKEIGYPHSLTLNQTGSETTVWIADMAGELAAGKTYGHCIKQFTYSGEYIQSIGECSKNSSGSGLVPVQFDRVTDLAISSKGYIYVTDGDIGGKNNRITIFDPNYNLVDVWNKRNTAGYDPLQFSLPHTIRIDRCDRVWIADTQNHRIQIVSSSGEFLKEWKCFNDSLVYGMDVDVQLGYVVITTKNKNQDSELLFLSLQSNDCSSKVGNCTVYRRMIIREDDPDFRLDLQNTMLHSVAIDSATECLYVSILPGSIPPLKFSPVSLPPLRNKNACRDSSKRIMWPTVWNATVLITPFDDGDLYTAIVEFRDDIHTIYVRVYGPNGEVIWDFLNIKDKTYTVHKNTCSESSDGQQTGWTTPGRDWFALYDKCECVGGQNISGMETVAWSCSKYKIRDWYWVHVDDGSAWRIFFNNKTNPIGLPVLGNYTMAHFSSYGEEVNNLNAAFALCTSESQRRLFNSKKLVKSTFLLNAECPNDFLFPDWPVFFHMTSTMIPVTLNNGEPLPAQVIYDWERKSQRTIMCELSQAYNANMTPDKTYIYYENLANHSIQCDSAVLSFGPPRPNWMTQDDCICKGIIKNNPSLSPYPDTFIAVCPVSEGRVFWTWFAHKDKHFLPLLFFETETPPEEGTGLALADYHTIYQGTVMIDLEDFEVPAKCL